MGEHAEKLVVPPTELRELFRALAMILLELPVLGDVRHDQHDSTTPSSVWIGLNMPRSAENSAGTLNFSGRNRTLPAFYLRQVEQR